MGAAVGVEATGGKLVEGGERVVVVVVVELEKESKEFASLVGFGWAAKLPGEAIEFGEGEVVEVDCHVGSLSVVG